MADARRAALLTGLGLAAGFASSFLGIGGGLVIVPALVALLGFGLKRAVGTSLATIVPVSAVGVLTESIVKWSNIRWGLGLLLVAGTLLGSWAGARLLRRLPERPLRIIYVLFLLFAAWRLWQAAPVAPIAKAAPVPEAVAVAEAARVLRDASPVVGAAPDAKAALNAEAAAVLRDAASEAAASVRVAASEAAEVPRDAESPASLPTSFGAVAPLAMVTGFAAGLSSVLFGIGGGVVIVPALTLLFSEIAFHSARATSLVTIIPTSAFGAWQHRAMGTVDGAVAGRLIPTGLAGAVLGVLAVNRLPARPCQIIFAGFLVLAAGRLLTLRRDTGAGGGGTSAAAGP